MRLLIILLILLVPLISLAQSQGSCEDAPLGIWLVWTSNSWAKALANETEFDQAIIQEYEKLNNLNANFMIDWVGQLPILSNGYYTKRLNLQVFATQGEMEDSLIAVPKIDYPGAPYAKPFTFRQVFKHYTRNSDPIEGAKGIIDLITKNMKNRFRKDDLIYGYPLFGEAFGTRGEDQNKRCQELGEYAIGELRGFDKKKPISFDHSYFHIFNAKKKRASYDSDTTFAGEILSGKRMGGWNIWMDFNYTLRPPEFYNLEKEYYFKGSRNNPLHPAEKSYSSGLYFRNEWLKNTVVHRDLSLRIEEYAHAMNNNKKFKGPDPEWWYIFQSQREWRKKKNHDWWLLYRRPTRYELRSLPFSALAAGAKGISTYCYHSQNKKKHRSDGWAEVPEGLIDSNIRRGFSENHYRIPLSSQFAKQDNIPDEEAYITKEYFPYDEVSELYADLQTLLPILRGLNWWWTVDGCDSTFNDYVSKENLVRHLNLKDQMAYERRNRPEYGETTALSERFSLQAIEGEVEEEVFVVDGAPSNRPYSTIIVGIFEDARDKNSEYYLLVNRQASKVVAGPKPFVIDAESQDFDIVFSDAEGRSTELVWSSENSSSTLLFDASRQNGILRQKVRLDPGDAILMKLTGQN